MVSTKMQGILWVSAGTLMHLYLGWFYLWGNVSVYITSYFHKYNEDITLDDTSIIFVIQIIAQAMCFPIAPFLLLYLQPWMLWLIGGVIAIGSVFISSFVTNFFLFIIFYGFFFGVGVGFSYMCPIIAGWEYFPSKKGLVSGIVVGGFGFGSFIFGFISLAIANPNGENPTLKVDGGKIFEPENPISSNAPKMIRFNCLLWTILWLITLPFLRRKRLPQIEEVFVDEDNQDLLDEDTNGEIEEEHYHQHHTRKSTFVLNRDPSILEGILSLRSLHIWALIFWSSIFPYYIASNFKSYGSIDIPDDQFMTIVGAVGASLNGLSRIWWATLFDYFGFKKVYLCLVAIDITIAFTFDLIHEVKFLYLLWVWIGFTCLGGHFSLFPSLCAKIFGPRSGGKIYSILFTAFAAATITNYILSRQSSKGHIGYTTLFYILAWMAVAAFVLALFFNESSIVKREILPDEIVDINKSPDQKLTRPLNASQDKD